MQKQKTGDFEEERLRYMAKLANEGSLAFLETKRHVKSSLFPDLVPLFMPLSRQREYSKTLRDHPKIRRPL